VLAWKRGNREFALGKRRWKKGLPNWIMKFDGVEKHKDRELGERPKGF